jgi:hypothetical protein
LLPQEYHADGGPALLCSRRRLAARGDPRPPARDRQLPASGHRRLLLRTMTFRNPDAPRPGSLAYPLPPAFLAPLAAQPGPNRQIRTPATCVQPPPAHTSPVNDAGAARPEGAGPSVAGVRPGRKDMRRVFGTHTPTRNRGTLMRLRQLSLWVGLVAVLLSSGCCCHKRCGWRHHGCCAPACCEPSTCCHPGGEPITPIAPVHPVFSSPPLAAPSFGSPSFAPPTFSAPPLAAPPMMPRAALPGGQ